MKGHAALVAIAMLTSLMSMTVSEAMAQPFGTFRWRTEPYCNVLNLTVTQSGNVFTLSGFDEPCGGNPRLPVQGVAVPQADGSVTFGVNVLNVPGGAPVNLEARITSTTVSGNWRDSAGQSGAFTFNPTDTGGGPRPLQVTSGPPGPAGTATAWATVNGFDLSFNAKSPNVASVTRAPGYPMAGAWCITFTEPIPFERRGAAVIGATTGALVILENATTNPKICALADSSSTPQVSTAVAPSTPSSMSSFPDRRHGLRIRERS